MSASFALDVERVSITTTTPRSVVSCHRGAGRMSQTYDTLGSCIRSTQVGISLNLGFSAPANQRGAEVAPKCALCDLAA
jgi:hypothetical protein